MIKEIDLKLLPREAADEALISQRAVQKAKCRPERVQSVRVLRRSIDARGGRPYFRLRVAVYEDEPYVPEPALLDRLRPVDGRKKAIIIGAGRLFCRPGTARTRYPTHSL